MMDEDDGANCCPRDSVQALLYLSRPGILLEIIENKKEKYQYMGGKKKLNQPERPFSTLEFFLASSSSKRTLPDSVCLFEWLLVTAFMLSSRKMPTQILLNFFFSCCVVIGMPNILHFSNEGNDVLISIIE